ncbi:MAG TPA: Clp protease ClpP [Spirochaetota bacterium]|nr:Clp protease ClpP [Spirochaetota bacterium]HQG42156.1 Clp protease ClpP [Spirochaetota bacterium]HRR60952.1 Clp protease ClpP [Spirochaetota bacterium]
MRNKRDIIVYASDLTKNAPTLIDYSDLLPFNDQLADLKGKEIDIILETPGGYAEVVEDLVNLVRDKYEKVGIIIPGYAKNAGTIFAMAGDEILMGPMSALGPIDAQILSNGKRFSADAFLEGLEKIKREVEETSRLNPAYIPILQTISPGEIQHCENAQNFSKVLVTKWLAKYKFKYWERHKSTDKPVTEEDKQLRANEIATELCKHSRWLTHGKSLKISDLNNLRLIITDYSKIEELNEAITRYYTLLRMTFDGSNIYKLFETISAQIYRFVNVQVIGQKRDLNEKNIAKIEFECPKCKTKHNIQVNIGKSKPLQKGFLPFPENNNIFKCTNCGHESDLTTIRLQIESEIGKKIVK